MGRGLDENTYGRLFRIVISPTNPTYNVKKIRGGFLLKDYIEERAINIANYIIDYNATVRQTAKEFGVNKSERHIRGGLATREKYLHMEHR